MQGLQAGELSCWLQGCRTLGKASLYWQLLHA